MTGAAPTVAVVIPCYNHARYLAETVASVVAQTYHDWELVIVDDGSTDGSPELVRSLIRRFAPRPIRLIQQRNSGPGAARNAGMAASRAPYILPLDADDLLVATFLEHMVAVLDTAPTIGFVGSGLRFFGEETGSWHGGEPTAGRMIYDNRVPVSSLVRRTAWLAAGGYSEEAEIQGQEDWDFWLGVIEAGWPGTSLTESLLWYRRLATGTYNTAQSRYLRTRALLVQRHPTLFAPSFLVWANAVVAATSRAKPQPPAWMLAWYTALVAVYAPNEAPKALLRPLFKAVGPRQQMYARKLAQFLGLSRASA